MDHSISKYRSIRSVVLMPPGLTVNSPSGKGPEMDYLGLIAPLPVPAVPVLAGPVIEGLEWGPEPMVCCGLKPPPKA